MKCSTFFSHSKYSSKSFFLWNSGIFILMLLKFLSTPSCGLGSGLYVPPLPFLPSLFPYLTHIDILSSSSSKYPLSYKLSSSGSSSTKACLSSPLTFRTPYIASCCKVAMVASCFSIFSFMSMITTFILSNDCCKSLIMNVASVLSL